ncbi:MAG TPA: HdeD family acid-resistance protein, partial [Vicinamibacterales bacterium]|nr:HdeD family acid-resistance protein [Vicinamibacterales bacterium]
QSHTMSADTFSFGDAVSSIRGWMVFAGLAMLALGITAIVYDTTATTVSVVAFGVILAMAGAAQIVNSFQVRTWSGFFLYLLDGLVRAVVGTLLVLYPTAGAESLTLVLSFYFIIGGLFKGIGSAVLRFPSWGWSVASAVISIVLGVMLAGQWPATSAWFIGLAVGIDLILYGWALLMFASVLKSVSPSQA